MTYALAVEIEMITEDVKNTNAIVVVVVVVNGRWFNNQHALFTSHA